MKILAVAGASLRSAEEAGQLAMAGHELVWVSRVAGEELPAGDDGFDGLIVFGGEISVADMAYRAYFDAVARLIHRFDAAGKPVLGSCLGAQALAYAFGGENRALGFLEFGFTRLQVAPEAAGDALMGAFSGALHLFEMHGDTFTLPPKAVPLMTGERVPAQAFRVGRHCYGFQCHFEATEAIASAWVGREMAGKPEEKAAKLQQIAGEYAEYGAAQDAFAAHVITAWLGLAGAA